MLMKQLERKNPFTNNRPGRAWYSGFLRRHPQLSERVTENVSLSRASVDEKSIRKWFADVESYLKEKGLINIGASRVFNSDETALLLNPKSKTVVVQKGVKNVYNNVDNNEKQSLTALITGNAAGKLSPPLILFSYQRIPVAIYNRMPEDFSYGKNDNGWMTAENFFEYVANVFYPWIIKNNILLSVILFVDGHSSHLTQTLSDFCSKHQVEVIALPPNTTHITQPMDVSVFGPLKTSWKNAVDNYRCEHNRLSVCKEDVGELLQKVLNEMNLIQILESGFRVCGLHPFSPDALDYTKVFKPSKHIINENVSKIGGSNCPSLLEQLNEIICTAISADTLKHFESVKHFHKWPGKSEDENLFYVWRAAYESTQVQITKRTRKL